VEIFITIVVILIALSVGIVCESKRRTQNQKDEFDALKLSSIEIFDGLKRLLSCYGSGATLDWDGFMKNVESLKRLLANLPMNSPSRSYLAAVLKMSEATRKLLTHPPSANSGVLAEEAARAAECAQEQSNIAKKRAYELLDAVYGAEDGIGASSVQIHEIHAAYKVHGEMYFFLERELNSRIHCWDPGWFRWANETMSADWIRPIRPGP
jgi:hypothetical protein